MTREEQDTAQFEKEFQEILAERRRQDEEIAALEHAADASEAEIAREMERIEAHLSECASVAGEPVPPAEESEAPNASGVQVSHRFVLRA